MRSIAIFFIPLFLFILQIIFCLPKVASWLGVTDIRVQLAIVFVITFLFIVNHIRSIYLPFVRFQVFERTKLKLLDREFEDLSKRYEETNFELRANVMLTKRKLLIYKEPRSDKPDKKKLTFIGKRFYFFWISSNMRYHEDRNLSLTINQGVCGEAYRSGGVKVADLTVEAPPTYDLCQEQIEKTRDVKFILSCPICELDRENFRLKDRIIGVVNFDSRSQGAEVLIQDYEYLSDLTDRIQAFADLCSQII